MDLWVKWGLIEKDVVGGENEAMVMDIDLFFQFFVFLRFGFLMMMMMNEFFLLFQFQFMAEFTLFGALEMGGVFEVVSYPTF